MRWWRGERCSTSMPLLGDGLSLSLLGRRRRARAGIAASTVAARHGVEVVGRLHRRLHAAPEPRLNFSGSARVPSTPWRCVENMDVWRVRGWRGRLLAPVRPQNETVASQRVRSSLPLALHPPTLSFIPARVTSYRASHSEVPGRTHQPLAHHPGPPRGVGTTGTQTCVCRP
jgi:hypothetical protein